MAHEFQVGVLSDSSWHGLEAEILPLGFDLAESVQKHGGFYHVEKLPIGFTAPDGTFIETSDDYAIARPPAIGIDTWDVLRTVKNRYEPLQNEDIVRILQPLSEYWPTAGWAILKRGQIFFAQLKVDEFTIGGKNDELHKAYLLVSNDHAQGNAIWSSVNTRVVCANTYAQALSEGVEAIPHNSSTEIELDFRSKIQQAILRSQAQERQALEAFFRTPVTKEQVEDSLKTIFPDPVPSRKMKLAVQGEAVGVKEHDFLDLAGNDYRVYNQQVERSGKLRDAVRDAFGLFNEEHQYAANTAYGLFQSVTYTTNHSELFTGSAEKNDISLHFGNKANINNTAWAVVEELSK